MSPLSTYRNQRHTYHRAENFHELLVRERRRLRARAQAEADHCAPDRLRDVGPRVLAILDKVSAAHAVVHAVGAARDDRVVQDDVQVRDWAWVSAARTES